jgi:hypothetical protein
MQISATIKAFEWQGRMAYFFAEEMWGIRQVQDKPYPFFCHYVFFPRTFKNWWPCTGFAMKKREKIKSPGGGEAVLISLNPIAETGP